MNNRHNNDGKKHNDKREHVHHHEQHKFFQHKSTNEGNQQITNVTVNVEQPKDDCMSGCFDFLKSCFKKG